LAEGKNYPPGGVTSTISASGAHFISSGVFWIHVNPQYVTWVFPSPVTAFGINHVSINTFTMVVGNFDGTGDQTIQIAPSGFSEGFFGLIGETTFTSIVFENTGPGTVDTYTLSDLTFGGEPLSSTVIPLPAAFPLFGTGLGILGFLGWRRRRKDQAV